jgi:hypothetical protein
MGIMHVNPYLDINGRAEWFKDADGSRTGTRGNSGDTHAEFPSGSSLGHRQ